MVSDTTCVTVHESCFGGEILGTATDFLPYLPKLGLAVSFLCVCFPPQINFWMPGPAFMELGLYIMAPEPLSMAYFINLSHQSCICTCIIARQWLCKHVPAATYTHYSRIIVWCLVFDAVHIILKSLWVCLCISIQLLVRGTVNTFLLQWRIVGGIIFHVVHVVSNESRWFLSFELSSRTITSVFI
jgi:hypothetical protein